MFSKRHLDAQKGNSKGVPQWIPLKRKGGMQGESEENDLYLYYLNILYLYYLNIFSLRVY